mgnify:CR=1 FL=1
MRGRILLHVLELLKEGITTQVDFFEAVLGSGYGASMGKVDYEFKKIRRAREKEEYVKQELKERRRRLQLFVSKMKQDGFIKEINEKIKISEKGKRKIKELKAKLPEKHYPKGDTNKMTIISFDIPEKLRRKRNWLREVIKNLDFKMVHQSVWVGKTKIPKEMINALEDLKILEFVEIFEISKQGTLRKI